MAGRWHMDRALDELGFPPLVAAVEGCWTSRFTADACCREPKGPCWTDTAPRHPSGDAETNPSFEDCCDETGIAAAELVHGRWEELRGLRRGGLAACARRVSETFAGSGVSGFLREFALRAKGPWRDSAGGSGEGRCSSTRGDRMPVASRLLRWSLAAGLRPVGFVLNFGAGGWEDPMYPLVASGNFSGLFVDAIGWPPGHVALPHVRYLIEAAAPARLCGLLARGGLRPAGCGEAGVRPEVDFLKVDVDSCDCELASAVLRHASPRFIWLEVNWSVPPPLKFARACHEDFFHRFVGAMRGGRVPLTYGCSLSAAVSMFGEAGYALYGTDGSDAVLIRADVSETIGVTGAVDEVACFAEAEGQVQVPLKWMRDWHSRGDAGALGLLRCNLTLHDALLGLSDIPFHLSL